MGIINPSFKDAGASKGEAYGWSLTFGTFVPLYADFGNGAWAESFSTWSSGWLVLSDVVVVVAEFLLEKVEAFNSGWGSWAYAFTYTEATWATVSFTGGAAFENFGWDVSGYALDWANVTAFASQPFFTAPAGWATDWASISSASFGPAENFYWVVN